MLDTVEAGHYYKVFLIGNEADNLIVASSDSFYIETLSTAFPTVSPSFLPSMDPSVIPSVEHSTSPSVTFSELPSETPSATPSEQPSNMPSWEPTYLPSYFLSGKPSTSPSVNFSELPSETPSVTPSEQPSDMPSWEPTYLSSYFPSGKPSTSPSENLSELPSVTPSDQPSKMPSWGPTYLPSNFQTLLPSGYPSNTPSVAPSVYPSRYPSSYPSQYPTVVPSANPSRGPTKSPTQFPTQPVPSAEPSAWMKELSTGFSFDTGQAGNMFNVIALETIQIREMDVHLASPSSIDVEIEIYTKHGSYHVGGTDASLWTQAGFCEVVGQGDGRPTPLLSDCMTPITILNGETEGIYVTSRHNTMRYNQGYKAGSIFRANDHLQITEGAGVAYPFVHLWSPRKWSGTLRYVLRSEVSTTFDGATNHKGNMFDIIARDDIDVREIDINLETTAGTSVEILIYTKGGSYKNYEMDTSEWELHAEISVMPQGSGTRTSLPIDAYGTIFIGTGEVHAFYISLTSASTEVASLINSFDNDLSVGDVYSTSEHVVIFVGIAIDYGPNFSRIITQNRIWNGALRYTLNGQEHSTPPTTIDTGIVSTPSPSIPDLLEIETMTLFAPDVNNHQSGIMFDVHTFDFEITIREMDIYISQYAAGVNGYVEIFSKEGSHEGHETSSQSWTVVGECEVITGGANNRTPIPGHHLDPQAIGPNSIFAFYVTLSAHYSEVLFMSYVGGNEVGSILVQNADLAILEGTGIAYSMQLFYPKRQFVGAIRYSRDTTSEPSTAPSVEPSMEDTGLETSIYPPPSTASSVEPSM